MRRDFHIKAVLYLANHHAKDAAPKIDTLWPRATKI